MFDFHHKIEALEEQWGREKQELAKVKIEIFFKSRLTKVFKNQVEARLAIIGGERDLIVKEQAEEEARIRNAKLEELKRRRWQLSFLSCFTT